VPYAELDHVGRQHKRLALVHELLDVCLPVVLLESGLIPVDLVKDPLHGR